MLVGCGALLFIVTLVLLALPQSRLRCVGLEITKWAMAIGLVLLCPSPIDVVPDVVPGIGWLDDVGYLVGAWYTARSALDERKKRKLYEEVEFNDLRQRATHHDESRN
ncbi:MAG: DUF1232 domain-containing protein [Phycisphaerae bacterium]|nr:DUF1232 domain-containing protein [Phycisphaerae bacterium]